MVFAATVHDRSRKGYFHLTTPLYQSIPVTGDKHYYKPLINSGSTAVSQKVYSSRFKKLKFLFMVFNPFFVFHFQNGGGR